MALTKTRLIKLIIVFFLLLVITTLAIFILVPKSKGKQIENNAELDFGYLYALQNNLFEQVSIPFINDSNFKISDIYYDGLRLFLVADYTKSKINNLGNQNCKLIGDDGGEYNANIAIIDDKSVLITVDNLQLNIVDRVYTFQLSLSNDQFISDNITIKGKECEKKVPSRRFEELKVDFFLQSDTSLYFEGKFNGYIDIKNIQLEHGEDWVKSPLVFIHEKEGENTSYIKILFTINKDNKSNKFNLIITGSDNVVSSIIPIEV